jgi:hypothetical protein
VHEYQLSSWDGTMPGQRQRRRIVPGSNNILDGDFTYRLRANVADSSGAGAAIAVVARTQ